jgi:hypothetical protein
MGIVQEIGLLGVRIVDLMDDDVSGDSCRTVEYPLVTAINHALRNNKVRPILTETKCSGLLPINVVSVTKSFHCLHIL